jgi:glycosyltransferase involved in cell wall biosynthesis
LLKKKITIISPKFHPLEDGLGQYTKWFYLHLKQYAEVSVITSTSNQIPSDQVEFTNIYSSIEKWRFPKLNQLGRKIKEIDTDILLFQYVPFMYAPRGGINFSIVLYMLYLRLFTKKKIHVMFHELHYPCHLNIKAQVMFLSHIVMLYIASISAHKVFCSAQFFRDRVSRMFLGLKKNIFHLPVGSNIENITIEEKDKDILKSKILGDCDYVLGCFGSFHPSKNYPLIIEALLSAQSKSKLKMKLLFIGATKENILKELPANMKEGASHLIEGTGFLSQKEVAENLQILDGFIGYFSDGVSTRRGSLIAALQHNLPVITTRTNRTEDLFKDKEFIKLLSSDEYRFSSEFERQLLEGWPLNVKNELGRQKFYTDHFDWDTIIQSYLIHLK